MRNEQPQILAGMLEETISAFELYVIRNATFDLNHDSVLAFIQRQKELVKELEQAQLMSELKMSVELKSR